ncbi:MAG: hypothetical protein R6U78_02120 [Bacteroidales bacterium]
MKTTKIFISVLLATLTVTGYGQIFGSEDKTLLEAFKNRLFPDSKDGVFITANYTTGESGRIEAWVSDAHNRVMDIVSTDDVITPVITRTIYVDHAEITFESDLHVESWMAAPFEAAIEEETNVESWMAAPFEAAIEEETNVESWMAAPFEAAMEEETNVEDWMAAPFEAAIEEETNVESWMAAPFEAAMEEEELVVKEWMTSPFKSGLVEEDPAVESWMSASWK